MTDRLTDEQIEVVCARLEAAANPRATQALTAIRQLQNPWMPIDEDTPRDLDECALWCSDIRTGLGGVRAPVGYTLGRFIDGTPYGNGMNGNWTYTAWMPLPTPPKG